MKKLSNKTINNKEYKIIPIFSNNGKSIENAIENAFIKYLKYNDYK